MTLQLLVPLVVQPVIVPNTILLVNSTRSEVKVTSPDAERLGYVDPFTKRRHRNNPVPARREKGEREGGARHASAVVARGAVLVAWLLTMCKSTYYYYSSNV